MFLAKKVNGQKLYKLARQGKVVEREPRVIHISRFDLTGIHYPNSPSLWARVRAPACAQLRTTSGKDSVVVVI